MGLTANLFAPACDSVYMAFGSNFGGSRGNKIEQYFVVPKNRQRTPNANPDGWKILKGFDDRSGNTVETATTKMDATNRAKSLAKKNNTVLTVYDAAKKSSRQFDYR